METAQQFRDLVARMKNVEEAINVIFWDLRTGCPKKGVEQRAEVVGMLSGDLFKLGTSEEMGRYLEELSAPDTLASLDPITRASVLERKKEYDRSKKIPADKYQAYVTLTSKSEFAWQEAKKNNDFNAFAPYLEQIVESLKEFVEIWGYEEDKYDALVQQYEPEMTARQLDALFGPLRERTVELVKRIGAKEQVERGFLNQQFPEEKQREFSHYILKQLGYDFDAGRLDPSAHPFMIGLNPGDVRVTTRYYEHDLQMALFATIHECGHALYEQNVSSELNGTFLATGASMGLHESQSRFWENAVGRSKEFWERFYGDLQANYPGQFDDVPMEAFYKAVNLVEPSLVRVEADELTYNLHIMIRYEIEKDLINGVIEVKDLPAVWEAKFEEYLGIKPDNHANGVLQDIHWTSGAFGYFPTYTLGNIYAAQLEAAMKQQLPNYKDKVREGDFSEILGWMTENVHRHGKALSPREIMKKATGEELNAAPLIAYLEEKYKTVYGL
ncbi:carboxypeptidase M32 [Tumebacillus sp. DT12]|uniref:Metal-dependent carboxypeptidase n=1 Tax=Tumebacillus lacus TaxID=2995335 RepID=A0ABT3X8V0_9BACL|nr:carboxypeptidase M32 [Tumebacillus lacus]MCX7571189.1 carboxypeptidase M32 [Tumebacillus lacus]